MEFYISPSQTYSQPPCSQGSSQSSTSLYFPNSQASQRSSQATSFFASASAPPKERNTQGLQSHSQAMASSARPQASQKQSLSSSQPSATFPLDPPHNYSQSSFTPYTSNTRPYKRDEDALASSLTSTLSRTQKAALRSYVGASPLSNSTKRTSLSSALQGSPRMQAGTSHHLQAFQEQAAIHSALENTHDAVTKLHQIYQEGFESVKEMIKALVNKKSQNDAPPPPATDYTPTLESQTNQLAEISTSIAQLKQMIAKVTQSVDGKEKKRNEELMKITDALLGLESISDKLSSVEKSTKETTRIIQRSVVPESQKMANEIKSRFSDVVSSIQGIIAEAMEPLSSTVQKSLSLVEQDIRSRAAVAANSSSIASTSRNTNSTISSPTFELIEAPTHSSVLIDPEFEISDSIQLESQQAASASAPAVSGPTPNIMDDWFSTFMDQLESRPHAAPKKTSNDKKKGAHPASASSWFEDIDDFNLFGPSMSETGNRTVDQTQLGIAAVETKKSKKRLRQPSMSPSQSTDDDYWAPIGSKEQRRKDSGVQTPNMSQNRPSKKKVVPTKKRSPHAVHGSAADPLMYSTVLTRSQRKILAAKPLRKRVK